MQARGSGDQDAYLWQQGKGFVMLNRRTHRITLSTLRGLRLLVSGLQTAGRPRDDG